MSMISRPFVATSVLVFFSCSIRFADAADTALKLEKNDHICLIGNALGERLQHQNHFEGMLHASLPELDLTVRNLCFPGDEPRTRIRSLDFGTPDAHLTHSAADVIVMFFGYNESFRLRSDVDDALVLADFRRELTKAIQAALKQSYNGESAPRIAVVSPIAFEETDDPNLPSAGPRNEALAKITQAMRTVASKTGVAFADVFTPTQALFESSQRRLTLDGGHLNDAGHRAFAPILMETLLGVSNAKEADDELTDAIADKNFHWFNRYRCVNGYSIYGKRGQAGSDGTYNNRDVMNRELAILDQMTAKRDQRVWSIAAGESNPSPIDDSDTLPFIQPKTNVGGDDDPNRKRGKLGSLDYLTSAEQQKTFQLADGYAIQLVASEEDFPELANPVALNFDAKGRLWVSTMPSYPHWKPKSPMDDKLLIFEDTDGDGDSDVCKVFADGLHQPTGFELGHGGAYIANQHDIVFARDTDGDDRADERTRTLVGFDTADSHHGIAALEWGPGGQLYFQEGTFKFSQVESPYGLTRLHEGGVWRFDPRTCRFGVHVNFAFANPWGYAFDHWGQDFLGDASPGYGYWVPPISARIDYPLKHPGGSQHRRVASENGYDDAQVPYPRFYKKRIRPLAGCTLLTSEHFPDDVQGDFLVTNVIGDRAVLRHQVSEEDSGFEGTEEPMLVNGGDGNFRPVDVEVGPDGALYIVDWHNALIGHLQHNLRDPNRDTSHGRIWRLYHKDRPFLQAPVIAEMSTADLVAELSSSRAIKNGRRAYRVRRELAGRDSDEVIATTDAWWLALDGGDSDLSHHLLEALWIHQTHNRIHEDLLMRVLSSPEPRARAAGARVLSYWMDRVAGSVDVLTALARDPHPRVRLEAVRAISHAVGSDWAWPQEPELLRATLSVLESPMDEYLDYTVNETMRRFEQVIANRAPFVVVDRKVAQDQRAEDNAQTLVVERSDLQPLTRLPVFFDLPRNIVDYQIGRLSTDSLLAIKASTSDPAQVPLHAEILRRAEVPAQRRQLALDALVRLTNSEPAGVVLDVIGALDWQDKQKRSASQATANGLAKLLLKMPEANLQEQKARFLKSARDTRNPASGICHAALMVSGAANDSWNIGNQSDASRRAWLSGLMKVPNLELRSSQRERVLGLVKSNRKSDVVVAAIRALGFLPRDWEETFQVTGEMLSKDVYRAAAVETLLRVPRAAYSQPMAAQVVNVIADAAEKIPKAARTTDAFIDSMQLADRLLPQLPRTEARKIRKRLERVSVRLVRIRTVEEEMRYDVPHFAVEAGRPVQVVLENHDIMPHNLVISVPGSLKEVAQLGLQAGPRDGLDGKAYVPKSELVLQATEMVGADEKAVITFDAPTEPGEYPYVCTFPQHWYRMYGVMVVVEDLAEYNANPVEPADPIGNNRSFVAAWTSEDFDGDLTNALKGRSPEIGARIFKEATCASCHQVAGEGGRIGPALDSVVTKWKGSQAELIREILHPSDRVDDQYAMFLVLTVDGQTLSGLLIEENDDEIKLLANAEAKEPTVIPQDDIEEMVKTRTSLMPKALMDQYTKDEVLELIAYLDSIGRNPIAD
ncbi:MAG: PVC-type heme-binding CxxCH protein [Planctomycetota bacterium]